MSEAVEYFFESYFHQDWHEDYRGSIEALEDFVRWESNGTIVSLLNELIGFRSLGVMGHEELGRFFGNFSPELEGLTTRSWLDIAIAFLKDSKRNRYAKHKVF